MRPKGRDDRGGISGRAGEAGRDVTGTGLILVRGLSTTFAHRDHCDLVRVLKVTDRRFSDHETAKDDGARGRCCDDALRTRASALYDAAPAEIEALDRGGRVADIEAGDRAAAYLTREEQRRIVALQRERLLVIGDEHDLARAGGDAERRGREGAKDIDDDGVPRGLARTTRKLVTRTFTPRS
jgi:hypothetical protein